MKVGIVIDDSLDASDGVQQYVLLLGGWLEKQGHEVHYLCGQTKRTDMKNVHSLARNVRVRFNKNTLTIPLPASKKIIHKLLLREKFDVLHVQMPHSPFLAARIVALAPRNTAIVGTFHVAPHSRLVASATHALGKVEKKSIKKFNEIMSVSHVAQEFAEKSQRIKSSVVPNAIDTTAWRSKSALTQDIDIVFLGRLVERKGCIYLLEACKQLIKKNPKLKVVIAGDGPDRTKLEKYVDDNKLRKNVTFYGFISEDDKKKLLQASRVAVFPATGGESFGIVLLEAMAARTLVLGGNNAGYKSVLGEIPGSLFDPHDTHELATKLEILISDPKQYAQVYDEQQQLVKQYDISVVGSDILNVYQRALRKAKD